MANWRHKSLVYIGFTGQYVWNFIELIYEYSADYKHYKYKIIKTLLFY